MRKIIITLCFLILSVFAVAWLYFRNISSSENSIEKVFNTIPTDASIIFEYKNEASFYDIFKDFTLFKDVLGENTTSHLKALKTIFIDDVNINEAISQNALYFSLHKTTDNQADLLMITPFNKKQAGSFADVIESLKSRYRITEQQVDKNTLYTITFSNQSKFHFSYYQFLLIGSFNDALVKNALLKNKKEESFIKTDFSSTRNKNAIANLYINYSNLHNLLSNFSKRKNPMETAGLNSFKAFSSLTINYQKNAFMFSGITSFKDNENGYLNLFLNQQPGKSTLMNILPFDAASYLFYYVSNQATFLKDLNGLFTDRKENDKRKKQLQQISQRHSINIEKEFPIVLGNEFGTIQLASGNKVGLIKSNNTNRLSFLLSTISAEASGNIRRLDDSDMLYYYFGDPFKNFRRPYYVIIENHLLVSNSLQALNSFLKDYEKQDFLSRTDKNLQFQQYLSNQGNIFYFLHNSNAKGVIRSYLNRDVYQQFISEDFNWKNIYGISIQYSADKDKFFTNLYMSKIPEEVENTELDTQQLDSLLN